MNPVLIESLQLSVSQQCSLFLLYTEEQVACKWNVPECILLVHILACHARTHVVSKISHYLSLFYFRFTIHAFLGIWESNVWSTKYLWIVVSDNDKIDSTPYLFISFCCYRRYHKCSCTFPESIQKATSEITFKSMTLEKRYILKNLKSVTKFLGRLL